MASFVEDTGVGEFDHWIDANGEIWQELEVFDQPAFAFVNDNGEVTVNVGALGEDELTDRVEDLIAT